MNDSQDKVLSVSSLIDLGDSRCRVLEGFRLMQPSVVNIKASYLLLKTLKHLGQLRRVDEYDTDGYEALSMKLILSLFLSSENPREFMRIPSLS